MQILGEDKDGMIIIHYDSRWEDPTLLGYKPGSPGFLLLRQLWEEAHEEEDHEDPPIRH